MKKTYNTEDALQGIFKSFGGTITEIKKEELAGQLFYVVHTPEAGFFLEHSAEGLRALGTLTRAIVDGNIAERFSVDINNVQVDKVRSLQAQAKLLARRAETLECEVEMPPMSSYERMIVHEALKDETGITTESRGEGKLRHIVICCTK